MGVGFYKAYGKWSADIQHQKRRYFLGYFADKLDAEAAVRQKRLELGVIPETLEMRLLRKRHIRADTGCWEWTGTHDHFGYGVMSVGGSGRGDRSPTRRRGRLKKVSRIAAQVWLGFDIDSPAKVLHRCDNPSCFNPEHLYVGTHSDNMRDMYARNRVKRSGRDNGHARLTDEQVQDIRARYAAGQTQQAIARRYGVRQGHVSRIVRGQAWNQPPFIAEE